MNKKFAFILIFIIVLVFVALSTFPNQTESNNDQVFHVTLANPEIYQSGIYSSIFAIEKGEYYFRFVPNGDSPRNLSISLEGEDFEFSEDFKLNGTLHDTGISEYYTWDYDGQKSIMVPTQNKMLIKINPNGNVMGSVSVDIIKK